MPQVDVFLDLVAKNADFFRKIMLKYGEVRRAREGVLLSWCPVVLCAQVLSVADYPAMEFKAPNVQWSNLACADVKLLRVMRMILMKSFHQVNDASTISARSFWLLCCKCKLVTPKCRLAHLDRLFILNRIRQLFPHPRVQDILVSTFICC